MDYGGFPGGTVVDNLSANAGDTRDVGLIPGSGRSPGGGNGKLLQYSYPDSPMEGRDCRAVVHGITQSWTRLKQLNSNNSWFTREVLACELT